ncbi:MULTISPECIES: alpha/beta fold hydrolase [Nonlabens]|uniref:alpha/beta fold hydrolase n=1 Tax=Nonlabens TaxID=363408 RepID=UPI003264782E
MKKMTYYYKSSNKPSVLLLHGFLGSKSQWNTVAKLLENSYNIIHVELPGHGESPMVSQYSIDDLAFEISQFLMENDIHKVHFIGHSMGGYVGSAFAKAYPQQLYSLTLLNSIMGPDSVARKMMRDRAIQLIDRFQNAYVSMAINNLFTPQEHVIYKAIIENMRIESQEITLEAVMAALRAMRDRPSQLGHVDVPVQYIYGNRDTVIEKSIIEAELSQELYAGVSIEGGHMLLLTHPSEIVSNMHFID